MIQNDDRQFLDGSRKPVSTLKNKLTVNGFFSRFNQGSTARRLVKRAKQFNPEPFRLGGETSSSANCQP
jgi:hypothetical protein